MIKQKYNEKEKYLDLRTMLLEIGKQSESWSDVLSERDWSMLERLNLSNYGNTQLNVKSLMELSQHSAS